MRKNSRRVARTEQEQKAHRSPMGLLVARFIRFYGMDAWTNPAWPTRDHVIPFQLFFAMLVAIVNIEAVEQLQAYHAALLAGAMIHGGDEGRSARERHVERLVATAYPNSAIPVTPPPPPKPLIEVVAR